MARDITDYAHMINMVIADTRMQYFFPGWNPFDWRYADFMTTKNLLSEPPTSPVMTDYHSVSASMLGKDNKVKYKVKACADYPLEGIDDTQPDFLRTALEKLLQSSDVCLSFMNKLPHSKLSRCDVVQ
jgi:hypothetical protein